MGWEDSIILTWQDNYIKTQRLAKNNNTDVLTQIKQDLNTGYHLFNAKLSRYFTRKQQFTDIISGQSIYQTPVDSIRLLGMTAQTSTGSSYQPPVREVASEFEWRQLKTPTNYSSSWITYYFVLGSDEIEVWPVPSATVSNGIRYYYQPQDFDLSIDDITSVTSSTTASVTNGSNIVTNSASGFTTGMGGLWFQVTGTTDTTWYEIESATVNQLTLKSAFVGPTGNTLQWRVGQAWIIPEEYTDAPMHYALSNYFSAEGNENRSLFHQTKFDTLVQDCMEEYSSSSTSNVMTDDDMAVNAWWLTPQPPAGS